MSSNEQAPFSLHANGAFVLGGQEIYSISTRGLEWLPGVLAQTAGAMRQANQRANEVAARITSIHSYLDFIQQEHETLMQRYPGAVTNIWMETLLVAMVTGNTAIASEIARARLAAGDSGGFVSGGKSFFERAQALFKA